MPQPALVIVDVQERLFSAMEAGRRDDMVANIKTLVTVMRRLDRPILVTEQYPRGLGHTLPELRAVIDGVPPLEKTAFSCCGASGFTDQLHDLDVDHVILTGIEAHVCVLLTGVDLIRLGFRVSMIADAVCSRRPGNLELALDQARQAGIVVTSMETIVFSLLGRADTDAFREISKLLR